MKAERLLAHHEGIAAPYAIMRLHGFFGYDFRNGF
jgi:hypothetical protein